MIGQHPLRRNLYEQFVAWGCHVDLDGNASQADRYDELCLLSSDQVASPMEADGVCIDWLSRAAAAYDPALHGGRRLTVHLLLRSQTTLQLLRQTDLGDTIDARTDVYAFTMEDQWAKLLLTGDGAAQTGRSYPVPDRQPVSADSDQTVHFVIVGLTTMGESIAVHAALTCHYPNYVRNQKLRTRITIVDPQVARLGAAFRERYRHLMDNSYWRVVSLADGQSAIQFHYPQYAATREDFVDVEWEFVEADIQHPVVRRKIETWAQADNQQLTIVLCTDSDDRNYEEALQLPDPVYEEQVPVLVRVRHAATLDVGTQTGRYSQVYPFGMPACGYDVTLPLLQLAKRLNYFYSCSFGGRGVPTEMPLEAVEAEWGRLRSFAMRYSNIYHAMTLPTKMRSLGHDADDWGRFYALTRDEIERTSAVEHNRWSVERMILGFRPPTDKEREEISRDLRLKDDYKRRRIHYDLCAYSELGVDKTGQDVRQYDYDLTACIPLIVNSFDNDRR